MSLPLGSININQRLLNALKQMEIKYLSPIQEKFNDFMNNKDYLEKIYKEGAEKAEYQAMKTLRKAYKKVGFISR